MRRLLFLFLFLLPVTSYQPPTVDDRLIQAVVELTNEARAANGQPPLALNDALTAAAQLHAEAMAANDFFAHDNPLDGSTPGTRITAAGYAWQAVSENLGAGYDSAEEAVEGWLNSPEHRDNLLSADYQETGVGYFFQADDTFPAAGASYQTYWVQTFGAPAVSVQPTPAQGRLFARGDLLAAVSNGRINWYDAQGNLVKTLDTGFSGETTGMAFDSAGNLYVTNFDADTVSRFDNQGNLLGTFGGPYGESPESIVLDAEDRFYVGHADGDGDIRQFDQNGVPLAQFDVDTEDRGSDWIELADDQCTMFYTSEGQSIKRFDICANRQLPDFASGLNQTFALRILPDGGVIVANRQDVRHLSAAGEVVQAYDAPGEDCWFAVNRDPDGASFWSGDVCTGNVYQFSLDTGEVLLGPIDTCDSDCIGGVAIFGELIEAVPQTPTPDTPTPSPSPTPTSTPTPSPTPFPTELVTMTITADPVEASVDQSITVRITLSGDNSECGQSIVTKPVDVILVLDSSGSMEGTPLDQSKQAALAFVGQIDFAVDRVGIVQFSDKVDMVHPLDTSPAAVQAAINTIAITGGTAIDAGLQAAFEELQANLRPDATPVIVLLSDGGSDPSAAERVADTAKAAGMKIVTVGLGSSVDTGLLQAIASLDQNNQPQFYNSPDGSDLAAIYVTIAQSIREYGLAQDLTLRHQLGLYDFFVVPESLDPPGDIAGDTITWRKDVLEDGDTVFTFQVRPRGQGGEVDIGDLTEAIFLECEQTNRTIQLPPGPRVNIQAVPEEIPPVPFECAWWQVFPWWLLLPLLLLLLVLIFLFLTPWGRRLWRRLRAKPWLCKLLALLTLLYLLFLIGLIAYALLGHLCRADRVYFWKITDDGQRVAVFESRFGDDTARPVDSLNGEANCAACHAGSSQAQLVSAVRDDQNGPVTVQTVDGRDVPFPLVNGSYVAWSPDGAQAAISMNDQDIFILDAAAGTLTPLAGASEGDVIETMPTWSHDGQIIAFVRAARTAPDSPAAIDVPSDVYTVPAAGG
ncbi:MAG: VWA domain-containing protein, partial [Chloroflexota bacterium]